MMIAASIPIPAPVVMAQAKRMMLTLPNDDSRYSAALSRSHSIRLDKYRLQPARAVTARARLLARATK